MKRDSLRILTIGNSFTDSLARYFQQVVESAGCRLVFDRANFGGCELERHWSYISAEEAMPICRIYQGRIKLRDLLAKGWDVVTIQQASHQSWRPESYRPFAANIFNYVRQHAPGAEVVIQQTWAYRADDPRLMPGGEWGIDQAGMYDRLTANYRQLAKELNLRIIPTGFAVQLSRAAEEVPFANYDPALPDTLRWPDLPPQAGDVVGQCFYRKDPESGELRLGRDLIHLNCRGQYLQACVWTAFLFGCPVSDITFVPEELDDRDAVMLRGAAQRAVDEFKQEKQG
ncbi:MAG: DUF4886 domain-containing protein [Lentisphaeria bacterium]|nr:DUF4886 domain-containing protein [Lentisphaeria bacterium]